MPEFQIMTPKGMPGPTYVAETAELAIVLAERDGFDDIVDVQDHYLVVPDDPDRGELATVKCPQGHPTGRQVPEYAGHGEGKPYATGLFICEVCTLTYKPGEEQ